MLTSRIIFTNFKVKINNFLIKKELTNLLKKNDELVKYFCDQMKCNIIKL